MSFVKATSIDDAIQHCLDVVEEKKNKADKYNRWDEWESVYADECIQCATDHQQLAEWLMELKDLRAEQNDQYVFIHELMSELKEAKQLLKAAVEDLTFESQCRNCKYQQTGLDNICNGCRGNKYEWRYADETKKLLSDEKINNVE